MSYCDRCNQEKDLAPYFVTVRPGGHPLASGYDLSLPPPSDSRTCLDCLTDDEVARALNNVTAFVLTQMRDRAAEEAKDHPSSVVTGTLVSLEHILSYFIVRNNGDRSYRNDALRALHGLLQM